MIKNLFLELEPGDKIVSDFGLYLHYAVYLGIDNFGRHWVSENKKGANVYALLADEYYKTLPDNYWIEKFEGNYIERKMAVQRALLQSGKPYDLISYNCEHYANEVQHGIAESKQVKRVVGFATVILLGIALFRS